MNYVERFTKQSFKEAIGKCIKLERFQVVVSAQYHAMFREIRDMFFEMKNEDWKEEDVVKVVTGRDEFFVQFCNGSTIKAIGCSDNARGNKGHEVLFLGDIDDEVVNTILEPMVVQYKSCRVKNNLDN